MTEDLHGDDLEPEEVSYSIGEVERLTGVAARSLRRWDAEGLAPATQRTGGGGHRRYTLPDIQRVKIVNALRSAGCSGKRLRRESEAVMQALG